MIRALIDLYILVLIVDVIVSYLPHYKPHPPSYCSFKSSRHQRILEVIMIGAVEWIFTYNIIVFIFSKRIYSLMAVNIFCICQWPIIFNILMGAACKKYNKKKISKFHTNLSEKLIINSYKLPNGFKYLKACNNYNCRDIKRNLMGR